MRKIILAGLSLAMCVSVASANRDFDYCHRECDFKTSYERKLNSCASSGSAEDCNKAVAAEAKLNLCMKKCLKGYSNY